MLPSAPQYEDLIQLFENLTEEQTFAAVCDALDCQLARGLPLSTHLPRRGVPEKSVPDKRASRKLRQEEGQDRIYESVLSALHGLDDPCLRAMHHLYPTSQLAQRTVNGLGLACTVEL